MPLSRPFRLGLVFALAGLGGAVPAQDSGGGGASYEVSGVQVDVTAASGGAAREGGWRLAERKGWTLLAQRLTGKPGTLPDSTLDNIVTGIMVEQEDVGANRYIARLGVLFDRARAASLLGVSDSFRRSPPMLVLPLLRTGGVDRVFERENPWQKAWERFRAGNSTIAYVRVAGTGPDRLLLTAGQADRNGRGWWHEILGQYSASDVLIPEVRLRRQWPGGPIVGTFIAGHGPDNVRLAQFTLRADSSDALDALLDEGVRRIDQIYQNALGANQLQPDRMLATRVPIPAADSDAATGSDANGNEVAPGDSNSSTVQNYALQVETPTAASVSAAESGLRGIPGVRAATTTSLALGGVSVMRVTFQGEISILSEALRLRGWQVQQGGGVLRIRRGGGGGGSTPTPTGDNSQNQE